MGMPTMQVQQPDDQIKMQNKVTFPSQGGQPQIGMPNQYSNTVGPWDNQGQQQNSLQGIGKGKNG